MERMEQLLPQTAKGHFCKSCKSDESFEAVREGVGWLSHCAYSALTPVFSCVDGGCHCRCSWLTRKLFVLTQRNLSVFFSLQIVVCRPASPDAKC